MDTFFDILQDKLKEVQEQKALLHKQKNPFSVDYNTLDPKLIPVAQLLEQLVRAKVELNIGVPLQVNEATLASESSTEKSDVILIPLALHKYLAISLGQSSVYKIATPQQTLRADDVETVQLFLAQESAKEIRSVGSLDKSLYPQKVQDTIRIE